MKRQAIFNQISKHLKVHITLEIANALIFLGIPRPPGIRTLGRPG